MPLFAYSSASWNASGTQAPASSWSTHPTHDADQNDLAQPALTRPPLGRINPTSATVSGTYT